MKADDLFRAMRQFVRDNVSLVADARDSNDPWDLLEALDGAPGRQLASRLRKQALARAGKIKCAYCPPHRGENRTHTSPHANVRKQGRRVRG